MAEQQEEKRIEIRIGDCFDLIKGLEDNSVDLIITSPPYADIVNYGKNIQSRNQTNIVIGYYPSSTKYTEYLSQVVALSSISTIIVRTGLEITLYMN